MRDKLQEMMQSKIAEPGIDIFASEESNKVVVALSTLVAGGGKK